MRVFWWQEGLHIEPETKEERAALVLLFDGFRKSTVSESAMIGQGPHRVVGNLELHPSGVAPDLLNQ